MSRHELPNAAEVQIAKIFGSKNASIAPTIEQLKKHSADRAAVPEHTLPPVKFTAARDQIARLCGSATPSPAQIAALAARREASASSGGAGGGAAAARDGLAAADAKLLAELESGTVELTRRLLAIADQAGKVFDGTQKLAAERGLAPSAPRAARPALAACTAAIARASASTSGSSRSGAAGAAAVRGGGRGGDGGGAAVGTGAVVASLSLGTETVWSRAASSPGLGTLTIAASDRVLSRLGSFVSRWVAGVTPSVSGSGSESVLGTATKDVRGTTAVLFALFPSMVGGTAAERAKVQQWCMDSTDPKYADAETESTPARRRAKIAPLIDVLNQAVSDTSYLAGDTPTVADLALWAAVSNLFPQLHQAEREAVPNATRWFKHVQAAPGLTTSPFTVAANCLRPEGGH